jgi:hypothetical protein
MERLEPAREESGTPPAVRVERRQLANAPNGSVWDSLPANRP